MSTRRKRRGYAGTDEDRETFIRDNAVAMVHDMEAKIDRLRSRITVLEKANASLREELRNMATRDISDLQVCEAYRDAAGTGTWPYELLAKRTCQPEKVCYAAMERASRRGLVDYGVSLRAGFLTEKGKGLLTSGGDS